MTDDERLKWMLRSHEDRERIARTLLASMKREHYRLSALLDEVDAAEEDDVYRFWHHSFKVYGVQDLTKRMADALRALVPGQPMDPWFEEIVAAAADREFRLSHNERWLEVTGPKLLAFWHCRYLLKQAVEYADLEEPPRMLPSGWAALLSVFGAR